MTWVRPVSPSSRAFIAALLGAVGSTWSFSAFAQPDPLPNDAVPNASPATPSSIDSEPAKPPTTPVVPSPSAASSAASPAVIPLAPLAAAVAENPYEQREPVPFAFADFSWAPGNYGSNEKPLKWGPFTGELRLDTTYHYSFNRPKDNTISGSSEVFRHNELQLTQLGLGGDFFYKNVHARLMTQFGMYSMTTPRNDASPARGQWRLDDAYRYISEAYAGYHINALGGINVQAGIFMSYVGLWSYYNFDNWTYQPSFVSSNTPWFFNGVRVQVFTSDKLKIEPWLVNGWQAYGKFNQAPGVGLQVKWSPTGAVSVVGNQYIGTDTLGNEDRWRMHTDDSVMVKYHDDKGASFSRAAASLTFDAGCEDGGGVSCGEQYFLGFMAYNRLWFSNNHFGLTFGGGMISNPGRYLVLMPPVNGATAYSGTPYFTYNPGDRFLGWDTQLSGDWMPTEWLTMRLEFNHRVANVPYWAGPNGVTPPGGNQGAPGSAVAGWGPDLVKVEDRLTAAMLLRY